MRKMMVFGVACLLGGAASFAQSGKDRKPEATAVVANGNNAPANSNAPVKVKGFQSPVFPGGRDTMYVFLNQNIRYPAKALKDRVQGDVFVRFTVKKDGTVANPKVVSGLDPECDKEAMRVLLSMPAWIPGKQDDKPVEMTTTVPVRFVIDK